MNKQQLASKIWESANKMRSKIEANEYKDYILGFIFYKFLSDKELKYLKEADWTEEDIKKSLNEDDPEIVETVQNNLGYFIAYENLFSTWLDMGKDFNVSNVHDALAAFKRLIFPSHKNVFDKIFATLETGLSKLGDTAPSQTKAISDLLQLIKDIPMDGKQDYDVLGFIYEYLISNFAANAGKKAGEFYTPHEVSLLMSEIVADHLKDRKEIKIYDPTSGSGSLLINIGKSVAKHMDESDNIKYYAQELKENTYNLTRMNLVMRGILPSNIVTRNGDTLEEDWPYFDDPLYVDAVVSNPPYSQNWNPDDKESDPRYKAYGLAPKAKADYAFLLHDLYHIKPDGIMTIVLPHGVLFRGGEEGEIRKNLIENNKIDAIIGLPANIFFGTGIPTIIMVLKQKRSNTDVLIVDASKGFEKVGKNNKLRASDIKRIVDVVTTRTDVPKFAKVVSREEIRQNDYNLNIPRYVDSSEKPESWDIYASMFGGIPAKEADELKEYWDAFPGLKESLFADVNAPYLRFAGEDIKKAVTEHPTVKSFEQSYNAAFSGFDSFLAEELIEGIDAVNISKEENILSAKIFECLKDVPIVDSYESYQLLDNEWNKVAVDIEIIQTEGFDTLRKVDPYMVMRKKSGKDEEVQEGWLGHVFPFELVQNLLLKEDLCDLSVDETRMAEIAAAYEELIDALSEDDKQKLLNDDNDSFVAKEVTVALKEMLVDVTTDETMVLSEYLSAGKKNDKLKFISEHPEIRWNDMQMAKDGTYSNSNVTKYIDKLKAQYPFTPGTYEYVLVEASKLLDEEKELKKQVKVKAEALHNKTKDTIENLTDDEVKELLKQKWIFPVVSGIASLPGSIVNGFVGKLVALAKKYETTLFEVESKIGCVEEELVGMIDDLTGNDFDMQGLAELKKLLGGA